MRRFSDRELELLEQLYKRPSVVGRLTGREDPRLQMLRELGASGATWAVLYIAPLLFDSEGLSKAASSAISTLLSGVPTEDIVELDEAMRSYNSPWRMSGRRPVQPTQLQQLRVASEDAAAVFGLLSGHPNGHLREAAVRELSKVDDGSDVPFLLIRLNDWVEQVRDVSRSAVMNRLQANHVKAFFTELDLVFRLEKCRRDDHSATVQAVVGRLVASESAEYLSAALQSGSRFVRRRAYTATMVAEGADTALIIRLALTSKDGALRLWGLRDATGLCTDAELRELLPGMLTDTFHPVRREALNCVNERFPAEATKALTEALLDPTHAVRDFARFYLRKSGTFDVAEFYRRNLSHPGTLPQAIAGLGESGTAADAALVAPFLPSERPKSRAAALRSFSMLAKEQSVSAVLEALKDDHKKVSAEARAALARYGDAVPLPELANLLRTENRAHVLMGVLNTIQLKDTWTALPYLIEACALKDPDVAQAARQTITSRFNFVLTSPTSKQRTAISDALKQFAPALPKAFVVEITQWLSLRV